MRKKLPIGIQSFEEIRADNYCYVDKTHFIYKLVSSGKYYFLSRPRRFGKSLFIDTIKQAFLGRKELFEGLFLENSWDWSVVYPVIKLDFTVGVIQDEQDLINRTNLSLSRIAKHYGIEDISYPNPRDFLEELVLRLKDKFNQKVVVLVDEYDKPILDNITDQEKAKQIRDILKNLYSVLKPLDEYLKFVLLTGVSKFSKVSIFSGLNQLNDITIDTEFSTICGYTEEELLQVFKDWIENIDIKKVRKWYNGYSFCGEKVYNPFDVLRYLDKKVFRPYWFETGTPTFLIKLLMEKRFDIPTLENIVISDEILDSFDIDFIEPEPILFQTGYLTIKKWNFSADEGAFYHLSYPNKEVKISLNMFLLRYFTNSNKTFEYTLQLKDIFKEANLEKLKEILRSLFSGIPNDWYRKNKLSEYEGYYASVVYSFLVTTGLTIIPEDVTNRGRIDLTVVYRDKVYIIEFKVSDLDKSSEKALDQIKKKGYCQKYVGRYRDIYLIGIEFSKTKRNIENLQWEKI